jgi:hypothetical protein
MNVRAAFAALLFAFAFAAAGAAADPGADDPVRQSVAETIRRLDLQTDLPRAGVIDESQWQWHRLHVPHWVYYAAVAAFAIVILYILRDMMPGWRARGDDGWAEAGAGGVGAPLSPEASLADADALAGQGRFVDAMHLLLLRSLAEIRRRLKLEFSDSLTSREIMRRARLPDDGAAALRGIVTRVELSYFGDHPAARPDYEACRARYEELTGILTRSAA